ncbi:transcriptional regulator, partial [Pseudomonas sp. R9.37]
ACPALGCEAAPKPDNYLFLKKCGDCMAAASRPNAGQARSPQEALSLGF